MARVSLLMTLLTLAFLTACDNNTQNEAELTPPSTVHPPEEAITDSTKLVNDSVIVPDTDSGTKRMDSTR